MPRQNRVTPSGEIIAIPERGTLLGNRGVLHDAAGRIRRAWQLKRWILCLLEFKGRKRQVMTPGRYTELFFLDEATGLAAGHRPCAECRRDRFDAFCRAWQVARPETGQIRAEAIDKWLHTERLTPGGSKRTFPTSLDDLLDGVFVMLEGEKNPYLVRGNLLLAWSPGGYGMKLPRPRGLRVTVLTPPLTVEAIRAGYAPEVHLSSRLV